MSERIRADLDLICDNVLYGNEKRLSILDWVEKLRDPLNNLLIGNLV